MLTFRCNVFGYSTKKFDTTYISQFIAKFYRIHTKTHDETIEREREMDGNIPQSVQCEWGCRSSMGNMQLILASEKLDDQQRFSIEMN